MSCEYIFDLATGIWVQIGEPTSPSVSYISGKLISNSQLGKLNIVIGGCRSGISGCVTPELNPDEQAIYETIYLRDYFNTKSNQVLTNIVDGTNGASFISITEGDSRITKANMSEVSKNYRNLAKDLTENLNRMADLYKRGLAVPRSVDLVLIDPYPYPNGYLGISQRTPNS